MQELLIKYLKEHPILVFVLCLLGAAGAWAINLPSWNQAFTPQSLGSLVLGLVSVTGAGGAVSIISKVNDGK